MAADFELDNDLRDKGGRNRDPEECPAGVVVGEDSADAEHPAAGANGGSDCGGPPGGSFDQHAISPANVTGIIGRWFRGGDEI